MESICRSWADASMAFTPDDGWLRGAAIAESEAQRPKPKDGSGSAAGSGALARPAKEGPPDGGEEPRPARGGLDLVGFGGRAAALEGATGFEAALAEAGRLPEVAAASLEVRLGALPWSACDWWAPEGDHVNFGE